MAADVRGLGELQAQLRALSFLEVCLWLSLRNTLFISANLLSPASQQPVGLESAALVRHLLAEFQRASDARERAERALAAAQREALENSQALLPLRKENAALTRENNSVREWGGGGTLAG